MKPNLSYDSLCFYKDGLTYIPCIAERGAEGTQGFTEEIIYLRAFATDDLDWKEELEKASFASSIVWEIDLGISQDKIYSDDGPLFQVHTAALSHFSKSVYPQFEEKTFGIILFRQEGLLEDQLCWNEALEQYYEEWLKEVNKEPTSWQRRLFVASVVSEYLHRLAAFLPEEIPIFALMNCPEDIKKSHIVQLFSKTRFEHIMLAIKDSNILQGQLSWESGKSTMGYIGKNKEFIPEKVPLLGVVLPLDEYCSEKILSLLEEILCILEEKAIAYRVLPEAFLTEFWNELTTLVIIEDALSQMGKRKVQGFIASGGDVIYYTRNSKLDFPVFLASFLGA